MADESLSFLARLKRHHIFRVASVYAIVAWVLVQVANAVFPDIGLTRADVRIVLIVVVLVFPVALVLGWMFIPPSKENPTKFSSWQRLHWRLGTVLSLVVIVLAVISGSYLWHVTTRQLKADEITTAKAVAPTPAPVAATSIPAKSIAVLPFENLSPDKNNAYFADGMQDMILTKLAGIGDLKVIARTSTAMYASHPDDLKTIGQQLGVAAILEGSVQKSGNQVLINVQLIDVRTNSHLWAEAYQRNLNNIFSVEGEVAQKVANALDAKLTPAESQAVARIPTTNPEAYTLYLKALHAIDQGLSGGFSDSDLQAAATYLQQAIKFDPGFALAYAQLSRVQGDLVLDQYDDSKAMRRSALVNAEKALTLQPDLAAGHVSLAGAYLIDGRTDQALEQLQTAVRLSPNDAGAALVLFFAYASRSQWQQAGAAIAQAMRLDPHYTPVYFFSALLNESQRRYAAARQTLEQGLAILPGDQTLLLGQADLFLLLGKPDDALTVLAKVTPSTDKNAETWQAHMLLRQYVQARNAAGQLYIHPNYVYTGLRPLRVAVAETALGNRAHAHAALRQARDQVQAALRQHPDASSLYDTLARIEMWSGNQAPALHAADKAWLLSQHEFGVAWSGFGNLETKAEVLAHFGDTTGAVRLLDQLLTTEGAGAAISPGLLRLDPAWDPIRNDERFQALMNRLNASLKTFAAHAQTAP